MTVTSSDRGKWLSITLAWIGIAGAVGANLLWVTGRLPWLAFGFVLLSAGLLTAAVLIRSADASVSRKASPRERHAAALFLVIYLVVFMSYQSSWQIFGRFDQHVWATLNVVALVLIFRRALTPKTV
jgi:hypothetical protein